MQSLSQFSTDNLKKIKYVLCDIDDTVSTGGRLTAEAYSAL